MFVEEYRGYQIKAHPKYPASKIIVTAGQGGKIPDVLSGLFTSSGIAKHEVDKYLETKSKKDTKNAEAISKS